MTEISVKPTYAAIAPLRDIAEPWIDLWGGDEWGESMRDLHGAAHTDYGLRDEDCATVVAMLWRNIITQKGWVDTEGDTYDFWEPEAVAETQAKARERREYWRKGGNLGDFATTIADAKAVIDQLPGWVFGDDETAARPLVHEPDPVAAERDRLEALEQLRAAVARVYNRGMTYQDNDWWEAFCQLERGLRP